MSDLRVDTGELEATGAALRLLAGELRDADRIVDDASAAVGHRGLADQLRHMQSSWDDRRAHLQDGIQALAEAATTAGRTFDDIETHLVAALEGS